MRGGTGYKDLVTRYEMEFNLRTVILGMKGNFAPEAVHFLAWFIGQSFIPFGDCLCLQSDVLLSGFVNTFWAFPKKNSCCGGQIVFKGVVAAFCNEACELSGDGWINSMIGIKSN